MGLDINLAEDIYPVSDLQSQAKQLVKKAQTTKRPLIITEEGRSTIAMLDIAEFQLLREQAALVQDVLDIVRAEEGPFRRKRVVRLTSHKEVKSRYSWLFEEQADAATTSLLVATRY
jgi:prevent-host-death family protein